MPIPAVLTRATLLALVGLALPVAGATPGGGVPPASKALDRYELARVDVRGTAASIAMIADDIDALSPARRAEAAAALRMLSVNCPYTRAALQLAFVLEAAVGEIDPLGLDPLVRRDWETLQDGLATHVAVLASLGVDLPVPVAGDQLHGHPSVARLDVDDLLVADDPVALTRQLVDGITAVAREIDADTMARIEAESDRVEAATGIVRPCPRGPWSVQPGHPWTLGMQLGGWHDALRRVQPFVDDPAVGAQVDALVAVLDAYGQAQDASRSAGGNR